jgi:hypothetical protein
MSTHFGGYMIGGMVKWPLLDHMGMRYVIIYSEHRYGHFHNATSAPRSD